LLGTVILYLDFSPSLLELKRLVENNPKWTVEYAGCRSTDTKQSTIEVRALVSGTIRARRSISARSGAKVLIEFLRRDYPESLPRVRIVNEPPDEEIRRKKIKRWRAVSGKEHERGSKSPVLHPDEKAMVRTLEAAIRDQRSEIGATAVRPGKFVFAVCGFTAKSVGTSPSG